MTREIRDNPDIALNDKFPRNNSRERSRYNYDIIADIFATGTELFSLPFEEDSKRAERLSS